MKNIFKLGIVSFIIIANSFVSEAQLKLSHNFWNRCEPYTLIPLKNKSFIAQSNLKTPFNISYPGIVKLDSNLHIEGGLAYSYLDYSPITDATLIEHENGFYALNGRYSQDTAFTIAVINNQFGAVKTNEYQWHNPLDSASDYAPKPISFFKTSDDKLMVAGNILYKKTPNQQKLITSPFICKIDTGGAIIWSNVYPISDTVNFYTKLVHTATDGSVLVFGSMTRIFGVLESTAKLAYFIINQDGTLKSSGLNVLNYDADGEVTIGQDYSFDNTGLIIPASHFPSNAAILYKLDYDGNVTWSHQYSSNSPNHKGVTISGVLQNGDDSIIFTGFTANTSGFLAKSQFVGGSINAINNTVNWCHIYGAAATTEGQGTGITRTANNQVVLLGNIPDITKTQELDGIFPYYIKIDEQTGNGGCNQLPFSINTNDYSVTKTIFPFSVPQQLLTGVRPVQYTNYPETETGIILSDSIICGTSVRIIEREKLTISVETFPMPFSDEVTIAAESDKLQQLTLTIYDLLGNQLYQQTDNLKNRQAKFLLRMGSLPDGMYSYILTDGGIPVYSGKLVK